MKYKCLDCGEVFEEPRKYTERHGFADGLYEHWEGCPECGGAYVEYDEDEGADE